MLAVSNISDDEKLVLKLRYPNFDYYSRLAEIYVKSEPLLWEPGPTPTLADAEHQSLLDRLLMSYIETPEETAKFLKGITQRHQRPK